MSILLPFLSSTSILFPLSSSFPPLFRSFPLSFSLSSLRPSFFFFFLFFFLFFFPFLFFSFSFSLFFSFSFHASGTPNTEKSPDFGLLGLDLHVKAACDPKEHCLCSNASCFDDRSSAAKATFVRSFTRSRRRQHPSSNERGFGGYDPARAFAVVPCIADRIIRSCPTRDISSATKRSATRFARGLR